MYTTKSRCPRARDLFNNALVFAAVGTEEEPNDYVGGIAKPTRSAYEGAQMLVPQGGKWPLKPPHPHQLEDGEPEVFEDGHARGEQEKRLGFGSGLPLSRDDLSSVLEVQRHRVALQKEEAHQKAFEARARGTAADGRGDADVDADAAAAPPPPARAAARVSASMVLATPTGTVTLRALAAAAAAAPPGRGAPSAPGGTCAAVGLTAGRPAFSSGYDQAHSEDCVGGADRFGTTNLASALAADGRNTRATQSWRPEPPKIHALHYGPSRPASTDIGGGL